MFTLIDADITVIWIIHENDFGSLFGDEQAQGWILFRITSPYEIFTILLLTVLTF